jgi:putative ABC transport system ATP-binding protein
VSRTYHRGAEDVLALRDVDLELTGAEVVALVGPSGSGKTTLLNLICGWEVQDSGELLWHTDGGGMKDRPWREVSIVPQALGLLEDLTVRENIMLPARLGEDVPGDSFGHLVDVLHLEPFLDRRPRETSLGEQQRTAIARALLLEPSLLLADEPTAHQDAANADRILGCLRSAASRGTCCLIATHSPDVMAAAGRVLRLTDGTLT